ncbi:MAG TPA: DUF5317 family protein [Gaiellaceae bacterium]
MVLVYPLVVGLLVAPLLGGDLRKLAQLRLRGVSLLYLALGLQLVAFPVGALPVRVGDSTAVVLWLLSYGLLAVATVLNIRRAGLPLIAAGVAANVAAVVANGGHMPVLPEAMHAAGYAYGVHFNSAALASPHFAWLVDRWAAPRWLPGANVFSLGDVLIALGGLLFPLGATGVLRRLRLRLPGSTRQPVLQILEAKREA